MEEMEQLFNRISGGRSRDRIERQSSNLILSDRTRGKIYFPPTPLTPLSGNHIHKLGAVLSIHQLAALIRIAGVSLAINETFFRISVQQYWD
jgi:hypothetical protein